MTFPPEIFDGQIPHYYDIKIVEKWHWYPKMMRSADRGLNLAASVGSE
jgi:hypothetical protein